MARTWAITGPAKTDLVNGAGEASFTITNQTAMATRGLVRILPEGQAKPEMFKIVGESTLDWGPNETKQVTVQINAQGAAAGSYVYSFAVVSEGDPSELSDRISSSFDVKDAPVKKPFPVGILIAVILGLLVIGGAVAFFLMRGGGEGNGDITLKPLKGMDRTAAEAALAELKLESQFSVKENDSVKNNIVIETDPPPGTKLAEGDSVTLVLSTGPVLPPVSGTQDEATALLSEAGFDYQVSNVQNDAAQGTVIGTDPGQGERLQPGQKVILSVSLGPDTSDLATVSPVVGFTEEVAIQQLSADGFIDIKPTYRCSESDAPQTVIGQDPLGSQQVPRTQTIHITVAISPGVDTYELPDVDFGPWGQFEGTSIPVPLSCNEGHFYYLDDYRTLLGN